MTERAHVFAIRDVRVKVEAADRRGFSEYRGTVDRRKRVERWIRHHRVTSSEIASRAAQNARKNGLGHVRLRQPLSCLYRQCREFAAVHRAPSARLWDVSRRRLD